MLIARNAASTVSRSLLRARLPLRATAAVRLGNACLVSRSASTAAAVNVEAEETPSWEEYASKPDTTTSAAESQLPVEDPAAVPSPHLPFSALKRRVNHDSLKALTKRPFNFEYMSEVQERVLSLMPDLVGFEERPPHGVTKAEWEAQKPEEERNLPPPTKKDLLVKAKTGTGKTVVRQSYVVDPLQIRTDVWFGRLSWYLPSKGVCISWKRKLKRQRWRSLETFPQERRVWQDVC
jgi:ATP-dependent RNA helicase MSS116